MSNNDLIDFRKFCTYRLPTWKNEDATRYWKTMSARRTVGREWHHLMKRQYGHLLIVNIPIEQHKRIHNIGYKDGEFEDLFILAIKNLINYISYLHKGDVK